MFVLGLGCLSAAVFWEMHHPDPVIDFRLVKVRNFGIANIFYFVFGFGLFASTTMIPQMLQQLYGYRAINAGLVLGPGVALITVLAPVGAQLVQRGIVHPRVLLFGSFVVILRVHGYSAGDAVQAATLRAYDQLGAQTHLLGFMDCFRIIGVVTLLIAPLVWLTNNFRAGKSAAQGH